MSIEQIRRELISRYDTALQNYRDCAPKYKEYHLGQIHMLESILTHLKLVKTKNLIKF